MNNNNDGHTHKSAQELEPTLVEFHRPLGVTLIPNSTMYNQGFELRGELQMPSLQSLGPARPDEPWCGLLLGHNRDLYDGAMSSMGFQIDACYTMNEEACHLSRRYMQEHPKTCRGSPSVQGTI